MVSAKQNEKRLKHRALAGAALQLLLVAAVLALVGFIVVPRLRTGGAFIAAAIAILYLWYVARTLRIYAGMQPRVVPYFDVKDFRSHDPSQAIAEESRAAFRAGAGIAANLPRLDDLATQAGVAPLSSFGFSDDLLNQQPQWSDLADGLRTLSALLARLREPESARPFDPITISDLQTLAAALEKAQQRQRRFCLVLRHGTDDFISGVEMQKRQGSFWF